MELVGESLRRHRRGKVKALAVGASQFDERLALCLGPLGNDGELERAGDREGGRDDGVVVCTAAEPADEAPVDLDRSLKALILI